VDTTHVQCTAVAGRAPTQLKRQPTELVCLDLCFIIQMQWQTSVNLWAILYQGVFWS
jgi:hypothetical protein